ncbi:MAG: alpha-L-fucosidase C-terminal domain-containing protein [Bacteroidales bacterium]
MFITKKDGSVYAIYLAEENETGMPSKIWMSSICPDKNANVSLLGADTLLKWEKVGNGFVAEIPEQFQKTPPCNYAWVIKISQLE